MNRIVSSLPEGAPSTGNRPGDHAGGPSSFSPRGSSHRPSAFASYARGDQWDYVFRLVHSEFAYCAMYGVNIVDGNIVSCDNIQRSLTFGPTPTVAADPPSFDEYWQALRELCGQIRNGRLAELRFARGRPISAKTAEGGRRFKRYLMKASE